MAAHDTTVPTLIDPVDGTAYPIMANRPLGSPALDRYGGHDDGEKVPFLKGIDNALRFYFPPLIAARSGLGRSWSGAMLALGAATAGLALMGGVVRRGALGHGVDERAAAEAFDLPRQPCVERIKDRQHAVPRSGLLFHGFGQPVAPRFVAPTEIGTHKLVLRTEGTRRAPSAPTRAAYSATPAVFSPAQPT
ncbi:hypothetical protein GCM10009799_27610 [Nocardiopsis rhodophaea]|uniref:Uncharacterized protein n=1 Tax=Nocardiopsis rhodophaea TaxID=280238 RepID=A0ABN2T5X2_9ACTN